MPRKAKPSAAKVLQGTFRRDRANEAEAKVPLSENVQPPFWLDEFAKAEWSRVVPTLEQFGLLAAIDSEMFANYCTAASLRNEALKDIETNGVTLEAMSRDGSITRKKNPAFSVWKEATDTMAKFGSEFGMSSSSRSRIKVSANTPTDDKEAKARRLFKKA